MIRVFIVDDEPVVRRALRTTVAWGEYGMEVVGEAAGARGALRRLEQHPADIVLTDIKMPQMSGIELVRALREKSCRAECVALSAYSDYDLVREAFKVGIYDYVLKSDIGTPAFGELLGRLQTEFAHRRDEDWDGLDGPLSRAGEPVTGDPSLALCVRAAGDVSEVLAAVRTSLPFLGGSSWEAVVREKTLVLLVSRSPVGQKDRTVQSSELVAGVLSFLRSQGLRELSAGMCEAARGTSAAEAVTRALLACEINYYEDGPFHQYDAPSSRLEDRVDSLDELKIRIGEIIQALEVPAIRDVFRGFFADVGDRRLRRENCCSMALDLYLYTLNHLYDLDLLPADFDNRGAVIYEEARGFAKLSGLADWVDGHLAEVEAFYHDQYHRDLGSVLRRYVDANVDAPITLRSLAERFDLSQWHVSHVFSRSLGVTYSAYLASRRMDRARGYLENTDLSITEVSRLSGYRSVEHFSRTFKRYAGESPAHYRSSMASR